MDLLICGASARAAAGSALRAGVRPIAIDLFADRDLSAICPTHRVASERWPADVVAAARELPRCSWIYTGGLENHPGSVDRISETHQLCGNTGTVLRAVRDPLRLARVLREAGLACPATAASPQALARGRWLVKPLGSSGGAGIEFYDGAPKRDRTDEESDVSAAPTPVAIAAHERLSPSGRCQTSSALPLGGQPFTTHARDAVYYQQWIEGPSFSGVFLAERGGTECAGVTRQLVGRPGACFGYRGSIGPLVLPPPIEDRVARLGEVIARAFELVGLFGVDFIVNDGEPWAVEVNPRYTASAEVLELATGRALLADHLRVCGAARSGGFPPGRPDPSHGSTRRLIGKSVVFAERRSIFPTLGPNARFRSIADVPQDHTKFDPGDPVLTVFAAGRTIEQCAARLEHRSQAWLARLRAI